MAILVDTNILLRIANLADTHHAAAMDALTRVTRSGENAVVCPQVIAEFWAVATRPIAVNGLGYSVEEAEGEVRRFKEGIQVIPDSPLVYEIWERLVVAHKVMGKSSHDARIVAWMIAAGIPRILTFNPANFKRFEEIEVVEP